VKDLIQFWLKRPATRVKIRQEAYLDGVWGKGGCPHISELLLRVPDSCSVYSLKSLPLEFITYDGDVCRWVARQLLKATEPEEQILKRVPSMFLKGTHLLTVPVSTRHHEH
jgi:hypothetical protein